MWLRRVAVLTLLAGCFEPELVPCDDGRACAKGLLCDELHATCVTSEQLDVCVDQPQHASCMSGRVSGLCFDGVCLAPGCGNRAIDPDEQCDDGNSVDGDGCSADCTSDESCNNGVVDPGEACDDGNLVSHDGCSSQCMAETASWSPVAGWAFASVADYALATFDADRRRLVLVDGGVTWELADGVWSATLTGPPFVPMRMLYDSTRKVVVAIGSNGPVVMAEWNGVTWTTVSMAAPPSGDDRFAAYDPVAKRFILGFLDGRTFAYDPSANVWAQLGDLPAGTERGLAVHDVTQGVTLVVLNNLTGTFVLSGNDWSTVPDTGQQAIHWGMTYDATRGAAVLVGGGPASGTPVGTVLAWKGASWVDTGAAVSARRVPTVWHDPADGALYVMGGYDGTTYCNLARVVGMQVTEPAPTHPKYPAGIGHKLSFDIEQDALVVFPVGQDVWSYSGVWTRGPPAPSAAPAIVAYDPVRGGTVNHRGTTVELYKNGVWSTLPSTPTGINDLIYDHARRRIVASTTEGAMALASDGVGWTSVSNKSPTLLAVDRETDRLVGYTSFGLFDNVGFYELVDDEWTFRLSIGRGYSPVSSFERASVLLVPAAAVPLWEKRGSFIETTESRPGGGVGGRPVAGTRGRLYVPVSGALSELIMVRQLTSSTPDESCIPGEDVDSDGASGCADPDCWAACFPACPLATSSCI